MLRVHFGAEDLLDVTFAAEPLPLLEPSLALVAGTARPSRCPGRRTSRPDGAAGGWAGAAPSGGPPGGTG
ncbi:hypothetical protein ACFWUZ_27905 [Streptomyces sp. NPDC058646]|uniref:hypothetical protein n=1 Tax=Streptomyces sp. NPDC058646 TaxID=3346574 RepID=UPI00366A0C9D